MESLAEEPWDVVICGTGLQQSLLALALSRSKKRVLHVDPNQYYGEHEAAFSLQEAETFAASRASPGEEAAAGGGDHAIRDVSIWKHEEAASLGLSFPRAYSLALAPQIIHSRSKLLEQLVSSKAFRQVEFLAVGAFFVYDEAATATEPGAAKLSLSRIPSSREDVFAARFIPTKAKRSLMKFLKFAVEYRSDENIPVWEGQAKQPLADFLAVEFSLDETLRKYILALTLTFDGNVNVEDGLAAIHRHLTSMGLFGSGFCAVYPKWGGLSEIAQVACRAGAVGGGVYMLGTGMQVEDSASDNGRASLKLSNDVTVQTSTVVSSQNEVSSDGRAIDRLVAVVNSPLQSLFEVTTEGAPVPAVAVVAFPPGSIATADDASPSTNPVYAFVHSSDTGECPSGQSIIYLTTPASPASQHTLERALDSLLQAVTSQDETKPVVTLFKLRYVQSSGSSHGAATSTTRGGAPLFRFPPPPLGLAFDDGCLDAVRAAWKLVVKDEVPEDEYMVFEDQEGVGNGGGGDDDDDGNVYDD